MRMVVYDWIRRNQLPVEEIRFASYKNSAVEKLKICEELNAMTVIEDDIKNTRVISQKFPTILFSTDYNDGLSGPNIYYAHDGDSLYLQIEKLKNNPNFIDFKFLSREERTQLSYEQLENYYNQYRIVMEQMPYNEHKRKSQEEKYNKLYRTMRYVHSLFTPNTIILNPEMIENIKNNYQEGKVFIVASHTTLDDIQQVEKIMDEMSFFLVKNEFSTYPIVGKFLESIGCIYVERDNQESRIYVRNQMEKLLLRDKNSIILPEGTRNRTPNPVRKFEIGASSIAQRTGKYLVPIAIKRYDDKKKPVYLKICEPRKIEIGEDLEEITTNLEQEITREILEIENQVNQEQKTKRYFKK